MSDTAISVQGVGKKYLLGEKAENQGSLREALMRTVRSPLAPIRRKLGRGDESPEEFWALKDVSFEVKRGEVVGIIGRNGAGKSTLLKILSRITEPTEGKIDIHGRVGSLLEVGTGFHPELSGRENIFLNGAILGMHRTEIARKFDEIVAFAEVERFLDTPVRFYSSGMYMRLAFAVAAHLEPEILIIDEVLAVGDSGFQKKCLGKMEDVARHGRSVLFVSHNMQAVARLTSDCVVLKDGQVAYDGATQGGIQCYNEIMGRDSELSGLYRAPADSTGNRIEWIRVQSSGGVGLHFWGDTLEIEFGLRVVSPNGNLTFSFQICDDQRPLCHLWFGMSEESIHFRQFSLDEGVHLIRCRIPKLRLYTGIFTLTTWLADRRSNEIIETLSGVCPFEVSMGRLVREEYDWAPGVCVYLEEANWDGPDLNVPVPS